MQSQRWRSSLAPACSLTTRSRRSSPSASTRYRQSVGIVVGVIEPAGRRIVTYGRASTSEAVPLDGDTIFEIGSISKVFTSLLLADAVQRGEVALTDPISKYLPASVKVPERGRAITLQDLATHTSGLPRLPDMNPKDPENPYADYSVDQLYRFLSTYQLPRDVGASYEYSNLGAGLLGHILALRAGTDYESLVKSRITGPLGMTQHERHADAGAAGQARPGTRSFVEAGRRTGICRRWPARARSDRQRTTC